MKNMKKIPAIISILSMVSIIFIVSLLTMAISVEGADSASLKVTLLNQNPDPARAGDTFDAHFRIENIGGETIDDLQFEVLQNYPFTVIDGSAIQDIGTVYSFQTDKNYINILYKLGVNKDAVNRQHDLKIWYKQKNNNDWVTITFPITVSSKEFAQIIYVDKAKIAPGKETEMNFIINNIGNAPLRNIVFSWAEANGVLLPVFSDDTKYIKYLDVGNSTELKYTVIADVNSKPGLYQLDLSLKYDSSNGTSTIMKTKAGIFIGGETDFDVAFSESTAGQTSLSVANTGNNPAMSVAIRIPEQLNFKTQGSNSAIIGNLDKGDYTLVSFQVAQNTPMNTTGNAPGQTNQRRQFYQNSTDTSQNTQLMRNSILNNNISNNALLNNNGISATRGNLLRVTIDYTDTTGERRSMDKFVPIQFKSATTGTAQNGGSSSTHSQSTANTGSSNTIVFLIVAILVIVAGFFLYRKTTFFEKLLRGSKWSK